MFTAIKAAFALLTPKQKREYLFVAAVLSFTSITDLVGIAAIIPAITALIDFQGAVEEGYLQKLFIVLGEPEKSKFLMIVTIGAIGFIWTAGIITTLSVFARQRFIRRLSADISARAFNYYMSQEIESFYNRPRSEFLRNVNGVSETVAAGIIDSGFVIISRVAQLLVIAALLMVFNVRVTIAIFLIIAIAYLIVYSLIKRKLRRMNMENFESQKRLNQVIVGSYADYRNIHIDGRLSHYIQHFKEIKSRTSKKVADMEIIGTIPRNFIEILGMTLLLLAAYYLGSAVDDGHRLLMTISLFAVAAYKMLPSAQQIYHAISRITGAVVIFERVKDEWQSLSLKMPVAANVNADRLYKSLRLDDLKYAHSTGGLVINGLSAEVELKGVVRIAGPSGVGKTTLIELLAGLRKPNAGDVSVDDISLCDIPSRQWWCSVAYVNQNGYLMEGTIQENIVATADGIDMPLYERIHRICNLESLCGINITEGATNLSGGQKCRVLIARALYKQAQLLFLDETLSPLDVVSAKAILAGIEAEFPNCCIFIISHRNEELGDDYQELALIKPSVTDSIELSTGTK